MHVVIVPTASSGGAGGGHALGGLGAGGAARLALWSPLARLLAKVLAVGGGGTIVAGEGTKVQKLTQKGVVGGRAAART